MLQLPYRYTCLSIAVLIAMAPVAPAFQTLTLPEGDPHEADPAPAAGDLLDGDSPVLSRVKIDAGNIAALAGDELGKDISSFLETLFDDNADDQERLDAAAKLQTLTSEMEKVTRVQQSVARQVGRRVRLAQAAVSAMQSGGADTATRTLVNDLLVRTAVDYENGNRIAHTEIARKHYDTIRRSHPHIYTSIQPVFIDEYFNYNVHFVVSESLLSRIVSDYRTENGPVADCILGAWVTGTQTTDTLVRADIKPSCNNAMFNLIVDGRTMSNTRGTKSPAVIHTRGNMSFNIVKPTYFDGQRLTSGPANMDVHANNQTVGVSTKFDRIPIIGGIARDIARQEAGKLKTQGEAIAARKAADRGLPRFEAEVGQKFQQANDNVQNNVLANLQRRGIAPDQYSARSSETHMAVSSRTISTDGLAAPKPPETPAPLRGVAVQMHESALNAAIDSLGFSGRMTFGEVIGRIEEALSEFTNKTVSFRNPALTENDKTDFDFPEKDGVRVRFEEDSVVFILRTGFYLKDKDDRKIPRHSFEIPVGIELRDGSLFVISPATDTKGILSIKPRAIEGKSSLRNVVQARSIAKELLEKTFKEPLTEVDANTEIDMGDGTKLRLRATRFQMSDGWFTGVLE